MSATKIIGTKSWGDVCTNTEIDNIRFYFESIFKDYGRFLIGNMDMYNNILDILDKYYPTNDIADIQKDNETLYFLLSNIKIKNFDVIEKYCKGLLFSTNNFTRAMSDSDKSSLMKFIEYFYNEYSKEIDLLNIIKTRYYEMEHLVKCGQLELVNLIKFIKENIKESVFIPERKKNVFIDLMDALIYNQVMEK